MRLHLDTDFGGNPDDACALAMVLGWPDAELVGVTTAADPDGRRAGYVDRFLALFDVDSVPVAAGAGQSLTTQRPMGDLPEHRRFWAGLPEPQRRVVKREESLHLLRNSIELGATIAAVGPYTNLALLERSSPGALAGVKVVTMGGWAAPFGAGWPKWGPERDWNVQCDVDAALAVFDSDAELTFVPCAAAAGATMRTTDRARLATSGPAGSLLARQAAAHAEDRHHLDLAQRHAALPDDLVTFHWDPVTCAVALGWQGAVRESRPLRPVQDDGLLWFEAHPAGRRTDVVTRVDGEAFARVWIAAVEAAQSSSSR